MSEAEVINDACQQTPWYPGASFYPPIDTFAGLEAQLKEWAQFSFADLLDAACIEILPETLFQNGILTLHFRLNGKDALAYGWARNHGMTEDGPSGVFGQTDKAALVIPGSGDNQADAIVSNTGYQAILYDRVCPIGDGIVYVRPGTDFRFLMGENGKGLLRQVIDNYLVRRGTSLAILEAVETCAIVKWMKSQYGKTAVLGLSKGAYPALITALLTEPTAAVCASGVSFASAVQGFELAGGNGGLAFHEDDIIRGVVFSPTRFLFSTGTVAEVPLFAYDDAIGYTRGKLNLPNCEHITHAGGHEYPPLLAVWLAGVLA